MLSGVITCAHSWPVPRELAPAGRGQYPPVGGASVEGNPLYLTGLLCPEFGEWMDKYRLVGEARDAWAHWLSAEKWDVFLTLTDPGMSHPESMYKRWRYFVNNVNKSLYGRHFYRRTPGIEEVVGLERQQRGSVHAHGLIRLPDHDVNDPTQFPWKYWQKFASDLGGWAMLDIPKSSDAVVDYVTKYVCKEGDLVIGPGFNPNRPRTRAHTLLGSTA